MCCVYHYPGLADADEAAFASSIALQAYFEGRPVTREDMDKCLEFWKKHVSEYSDPVERKRPVCLESISVPCLDCSIWQRLIHPKRRIPYGEPDDQAAQELKDVSEGRLTWNPSSFLGRLKAPQPSFACIRFMNAMKRLARYR